METTRAELRELLAELFPNVDRNRVVQVVDECVTASYALHGEHPRARAVGLAAARLEAVYGPPTGRLTIS